MILERKGFGGITRDFDRFIRNSIAHSSYRLDIRKRIVTFIDQRGNYEVVGYREMFEKTRTLSCLVLALTQLRAKLNSLMILDFANLLDPRTRNKALHFRQIESQEEKDKVNSVALTEDQLQLLIVSKKVAIGLGLKGKCLTPLISELSVCHLLDLTWDPSDAYDAVTKNGERVQTKARKSWKTKNVNSAGRLGKFGRKAGYAFDEGVYAELDRCFEVTGLWRMDVDAIQTLENAESGERALHVSTFKNNAQRI